MSTISNKKTALLATAVSVLALSATTVWAQPTTTTPGAAGGATSGTAARADAKADASKLARADAGMLGDLAQANRAEVEAGQMALEKSQNADIKKFAQMMVDDHTKALGEVESLAQSKNVKLPDGVGAVHRTKAVALKALSGNTFDNQYAKRAGVGDHESTVKLLKKVQADAKDADVKALATKMLPTVEHHLDMAKALPGAGGK
jgi:putative membrane protein